MLSGSFVLQQKEAHFFLDTPRRYYTLRLFIRLYAFLSFFHHGLSRRVAVGRTTQKEHADKKEGIKLSPAGGSSSKARESINLLPAFGFGLFFSFHFFMRPESRDF